MRRIILLATLLAATGFAAPSFAADKVIVGYGTGTTALPYFVGVETGIFAKHGIDIEGAKIPLNSNLQSSLIANQIDAAAVMLAVEGMAGNFVKPGSITYISLNAQSDDYRMEQFVARKGVDIKSLSDFKGKKLVAAPGIGNVTIAKAALQAAGLKEGDYKLDQLDTSQHINVLTSGQYDGAFTLEPNATMMRAKDVAYTVEAGVVADIVLGNRKAKAYMAGGALSQKFLADRPEVAKRYVAAWDEALDFIKQKPTEARQTLLKYTPTAPEIVNDVPLVLFSKISDVSQADIENFQKYIDFSVKIGVIPGAVDVRRYIVKF
ncbi:ABC transporter substrate-binding protein [Tardiphaga sp. 619_E2_N8_5]|uniref:ABC transporter substrate-binding protein n=1 Tax=unclassified Tardiphaga TaxID=2631404 RepID=UPI003F232625